MRLRTLTAMSALVLLAGCGANSSAPQDTVSSLDRVRAAPALSVVDTSKITVTSSTSVGGQEVTFTGEGAFDYVKKTGTLSFDVPGAGGGGGRIEERILGEDLYLSLPQQPGVFYKAKVSDVAKTSIGSTTNPAGSLEILRDLMAVKELGKGEVRGEPTTRYSGTFDVQQAIDKATGSAKTLLQTTFGQLDLKTVPFEVDLDGKGRVVKYVQNLDLPTGLKSATTIELYDFGSPVTVTAPPAASVKDGTALLKGLTPPAPRSTGVPSAQPSVRPGAAVKPSAAATPSPTS